MRKIYENIEFSRVGHYQSILETAGIRTHVKNLGTSFATGEIPFDQTIPELWVVDDDTYAEAMEILLPYHHHDFPEASPWTCPVCGEAVEGTFGECWNCQAPRPDESD
jgi:hypothetical protein